MTTLFVDKKGLRLAVDGAALVFYDEDERAGTVPIKTLERVCIRGDLQLSTSVLGKLGEEGVGVVILSGKKKQPVLLMPSWRVDAQRRQAQFNISQNEDKSLWLARQWIAQKIAAQRTLLQSLLGWYPVNRLVLSHTIDALSLALENIDKVADLASLRGIEGAAAAQYFAAWTRALPPSWQFNGRTKRPPLDPVNAALSLCYTLMHFEFVREIYLIGLDPFVGFYHAISYGRESLACDLLEPLRPIGDEWVLQLFRDEELRVEHFSMFSDACMMGKTARVRFYQLFDEKAKTWRMQMHQLCRSLLQDLGKLSFDSDDWRNNALADTSAVFQGTTRRVIE